MNNFSNEAGFAAADTPLLVGLFGCSGRGRTIGWQVARKAGHCLVIARHERGSLASGLAWYRALRPMGKAYRAMLSGLSGSPFWGVLPEKKIEVCDDGLIAELEGSGLGSVEAILFGNPVQEHRRVMLKLTEGGVAKSGFSPAAMRAIDREAGVLERFGGVISGVPKATRIFRGDRHLSLVMEEVEGSPLESYKEGLGGALLLLKSWLGDADPRELSKFDCWSDLRSAWPDDGLEKWADLCLKPAFCHGDFAAWNLLKASDGEIRAVDWEWAEDEALPGMDIVHFVVQQNAMVQRLEGWDLVESSLTMLGSVEVREFLETCGWPNVELALACYAARLNPIFRGPDGKDLKRLCGIAVK